MEIKEHTTWLQQVAQDSKIGGGGRKDFLAQTTVVQEIDRHRHTGLRMPFPQAAAAVARGLSGEPFLKRLLVQLGG